MNNSDKVTQDEINKIVRDRKQDEIDKLIKSGELSIMTECAYGSAIADSEVSRKI